MSSETEELAEAHVMAGGSEPNTAENSAVKKPEEEKTLDEF